MAALIETPVEVLRTLFLDDLLHRPISNEKQTGGFADQEGGEWIAFDIDGTREDARQRALPQTDDLPPAFRRLGEVCAPGYTGRKRGQVVRTRPTVSQAHSYQCFSNRGNGRYREELCKGLAAFLRFTGFLIRLVQTFVVSKVPSARFLRHYVGNQRTTWESISQHLLKWPEKRRTLHRFWK